MQIDPIALKELKKICQEDLGREVSDAEVHQIGVRILLYLQNAPAIIVADERFDPSSDSAVI